MALSSVPNRALSTICDSEQNPSPPPPARRLHGPRGGERRPRVTTTVSAATAGIAERLQDAREMFAPPLRLLERSRPRAEQAGQSDGAEGSTEG